MPRRPVENRVQRVEPQPVDVVLLDPVAGVPDEVTPHLVAVAVVEVDRRAPWRVITVGEVGGVIVEIISLRPEVVVDHVEHHREAERVAGVDQPAQSPRTAVARLRRPGIDPVVAPVARAGELRHRHQLDRRDAELLQFSEPGDQRFERPLRRAGPDMQLIEDVVGKRQTLPRLVGPGEGGVDDLGWAMHPSWLVARRGVGPFVLAVDPVEIERARPDSFQRAAPVAMLAAGQRFQPVGRLHQMDLDLLRERRPNHEMTMIFRGERGAWGRLEQFDHRPLRLQILRPAPRRGSIQGKTAAPVLLNSFIEHWRRSRARRPIPVAASAFRVYIKTDEHVCFTGAQPPRL